MCLPRDQPAVSLTSMLCTPSPYPFPNTHRNKQDYNLLNIINYLRIVMYGFDSSRGNYLKIVNNLFISSRLNFDLELQWLMSCWSPED